MTHTSPNIDQNQTYVSSEVISNLLRALAKQDAALVAVGDASQATLPGFQHDTG